MQGKAGTSAAEYMAFKRQCSDAFNVLRRHSHHLINLFQLVRWQNALPPLAQTPSFLKRLQMLSTGIPELQEASDIDYLCGALCLKYDEGKASKHFQRLIKQAQNTRTTQFNDAIHVRMKSTKPTALLSFV